MKVLRTTIVEPRLGHERGVAELLRELDEHFSQLPGFVESYDLEDSGDGTMGRVGLWESREATDHAANLEHTLALRSRLHRLTKPDRQERLWEVTSEHHASPKRRPVSLPRAA